MEEIEIDFGLPSEFKALDPRNLSAKSDDLKNYELEKSPSIRMIRDT